MKKRRHGKTNRNVKNEGGKSLNKTCTVKSSLQQRVVVGRQLGMLDDVTELVSG